MAIEDNLRRIMIQKANAIEPTEDAYDAIAGALREGSRPRPLISRALVPLGAVAVTVGLIVWLSLALPLGKPRSQTIRGDGRGSSTISSVHLGGLGGSISSADGAAWVTTNAPGSVIRVDRSAASTPVTALEGDTTYAVAVRDQSAWVSGESSEEGPYVKRLNAQTGAVESSITLPDGYVPGQIAVGSFVWVAATSSAANIIEIDPSTNTVVGETLLGAPPEGSQRLVVDLVADSDTAWALVWDVDLNNTRETVSRSVVVRIDGTATRESQTFGAPDVSSIAVGAGQIWGARGNLGAVVIDSSSGETRAFQVPGVFDVLGADSHGAWFVQLDQRGGYLTRIDATTGEDTAVAVLPLDEDRGVWPIDASIDQGSGVAWILAQNGTVIEVTLGS